MSPRVASWVAGAALLVACAALLVACGDDAPVTGDDTDVVDTTPRCGGYDEPCAAITRPTTQRCGAGLDLSTPADPALRPWPDALSALDCFVDGDPERPGPDLIPYQVVAPLWTQGSTKDRWVVLPPGATIGFTAEGEWTFPVGSVLVKRFDHDLVTDGVATRTNVEMRFMARGEAGWSFATYLWDPALGDGVLEGVHGEMRTVDVRLPDGDHAATWWIPGLDGCSACHRVQAEEALGPRTAQLDMDVDYGGLVANQLVAWWRAGLLDARPDAGPAWTKLVDPEGDAPLEARARSWLHGNCAHCHMPEGFVSPDIHLDLRASTPTAATRSCGEPVNGVTDLDATVVIDPGSPDTSQLVQRLLTNGPAKMPPDGATIPDAAGIEVVRAWIASMDGCP